MIFVSTSCLKGTDGKFEKDIKKVLGAYSRLGIRNIELGAALEPIADFSPIFKFKRKHGAQFTVHAFFPPDKEAYFLNLSSKGLIVEKTIKKMKEAIEFCRKVDALLYSFHPGFMADLNIKMEKISPMIGYEEAFSRTAENLLVIIDYAKGYGIRLAMENMPPFSAATFTMPDEFLRLFRLIKHKDFGMLLDTGHMAKTCETANMRQEDFIAKVKHKVFELHIHKYSNGIDHQKLTDADVLKSFSKEQLSSIPVTLESNGLSQRDIAGCIRILEGDL